MGLQLRFKIHKKCFSLVKNILLKKHVIFVLILCNIKKSDGFFLKESGINNVSSLQHSIAPVSFSVIILNFDTWMQLSRHFKF